MSNASQIKSESFPVRINKKELIADGVMYFELVHPEGLDLPSFSAGSHVDIQLPNGLVRQYSLCGSPNIKSAYEIAVLLEPSSRGGSKSAHTNLKAGDEMMISHPKNHFPLTDAKHSILLAGGIGVTPILAMAEQLHSEDASFEVHYCSRTTSRTAFINRFKSSPFSKKVQFHFDDGEEDQKFNVKKVLESIDLSTHMYICGPKGFMDYVIQTAKDIGWPDGNIHFEFFKSEPSSKADDGSFEVEFRGSGLVVNVPADITVAQALIDAGINIPLSCEQGICGTCVMHVLDGEPDHRDVCLSDDDKDVKKIFTPCCSRSKSARLVLDF